MVGKEWNSYILLNYWWTKNQFRIVDPALSATCAYSMLSHQLQEACFSNISGSSSLSVPWQTSRPCYATAFPSVAGSFAGSVNAIIYWYRTLCLPLDLGLDSKPITFTQIFGQMHVALISKQIYLLKLSYYNWLWQIIMVAYIATWRKQHSDEAQLLLLKYLRK